MDPALLHQDTHTEHPVEDVVEHFEDIVPPAARKSSSISKPPIWRKDYVVPTKSSPYSILIMFTMLICPILIRPMYNLFFALLEPQTFKEAHRMSDGSQLCRKRSRHRKITIHGAL